MTINTLHLEFQKNKKEEIYSSFYLLEQTFFLFFWNVPYNFKRLLMYLNFKKKNTEKLLAIMLKWPLMEIH